jgi:hypothetical protein
MSLPFHSGRFPERVTAHEFQSNERAVMRTTSRRSLLQATSICGVLWRSHTMRAVPGGIKCMQWG